MKYPLILCLIIFAACTSRPTGEQQTKLKDEAGDAAVRDASLAYGRRIIKDAGMSTLVMEQQRDSVGGFYKVKILLLEKGNVSDSVERKIIEAYESGQNLNHDNVQMIGTDSIFYTKPSSKELPDGSSQFNYAIGIKFSRAQVEQSMKEARR